MIKKVDHIAIAVNDLEQATAFYQGVLGLTLSGVEVVASQKTKVGFFRIGEISVELIQPSEPDSPLVKFLESKGPGIHHLCFEVDDVQAEVRDFLKNGATMIDHKVRPGAHDTKIAFVHPESSGGVLIELCERPESC
jgi:methylmalonyl-CoA/ethylmalonyl-CoA epimerase